MDIHDPMLERVVSQQTPPQPRPAPLSTPATGVSPLKQIITVIAITAAIVLAFWPVFDAGFISRDDPLTVAANPLLKPPSLSGVLHYWRSSAWEHYTPVTYTIWSAVAALAPRPLLPGEPYALPPVLFHATNVLFHGLASLVVWRILLQLFATNGATKAAVNSAACMGALVFALHPLQVDSVAWVSGLKDVLAGFFGALAIWQYLLSVDPSRSPRARRVHYALCIIALLAGTGSKVSAAMAPAVMLVIDWLILRHTMGRTPRQIIRSILPIALICVPAVIAARLIHDAPRILPIWQLPQLALYTITFYTTKLLWPVGLATDYGLTPQILVQSKWVAIASLFPIALVLTFVMLRRRRPELLAGALVFLACIFPVAGFVPFVHQSQSTVVDHYVYLAMLGVAIVVTGILVRAERNAYRMLLTIVCIAIVALGVRTRQQSSLWHDTITLFTHNARVTPTHWLPPHAIGEALLSQRKYAEAEEHLRRSIDLKPNVKNLSLLAQVRFERSDPREAIDCLERAAQLEPTNWKMHAQLAEGYLRINRHADAESSALRALDLAPGEPSAARLLAETRKRNRT